MSSAWRRWLAVLATSTILLGACSVGTPDQSALGSEIIERPADPARVATPTPVPDDEAREEPTPGPTPESTAIPESTSVPDPTATAAPEPTPTPEGEILIQGDGWTIVESEFDAMLAFIEREHELEFRGPVSVRTDPDIGASFAIGFEPVTPKDWALLQALLLTGEPNRDEVNQARLDRIRGVCCDGGADPSLGIVEVVVEINATKLETESILVHELVHALHTQYPEFYRDFSPDNPETPFPYAAAIEGVPSFIADLWFEQAPADAQAEVLPELPVITDDLIPLTGPGAAKHLNYGYDSGPSFVRAIFNELGPAGLSQIMENMPTSSEQVLFPERYLSQEQPVDVEAPVPPDGVPLLTDGRMGSAALIFAIGGEVDSLADLDVVSGWAGDSYITYEQGDAVCLVATILMDTEPQAGVLVDRLNERFAPTLVAASNGTTVSFATCGLVGDL